MRSDYKERREAKAERATKAAANAIKESDRRHDTSNELSQAFYMGQPILIGHHSEKKARRTQEKMHDHMRAAIELRKKAEYHQERATRFESEPYAISDDDPEALTKLTERLESLRWQQVQMKQGNAAYRDWKKKGDGAFEKYPKLSQKSIQYIMAWVPAYRFEKAPYQGYSLTSVNNKIKVAEKRVAHLEALNSREDKEYEINGVRIVENATENRVQMFFDGKPSKETITRLKGNGWKYAPSIGCWQRQFGNVSIRESWRIAKTVVQ